ncbi:MAG: acyloxyacyl hydrolase [Candidatus Methylomirabilales bacterium]
MRRPWIRLLLITGLVLGVVPGAWGAEDGPGEAGGDEGKVLVSPASFFGLGKHEIGLSVGYGFGIPLGGTSGTDLEDVDYIYVAPRWGIGITRPLGGDAWYRGNFEFLFEGAFLINVEPKSGFAGGATAMFRYNFLPGGDFIPFLQLGAGIVGLDFNLQDQADGFNFTPQGGVGFHYFVSDRTALTAEWRLHHISNAGSNDPNNGINSSLFLVGLSTFLD